MLKNAFMLLVGVASAGHDQTELVLKGGVNPLVLADEVVTQENPESTEKTESAETEADSSENKVEGQDITPKKIPIRLHKKPFVDNVLLEIIGCVLMFLLIAISNAGGVSGAGMNIPFMLIFFNLTMEESIPLSAFVGTVATTFRFLLNYNQKHPHRPERNTINYEVIEITMPAVFLGTFIGVILNQMSSEWLKVGLFGTTVAWAIFTTFKKYL